MAFGTGSENFLRLEEGDDLPIFNGPQGGSHLYGAVEACNVDGPLDIAFTVHDDTLGQVIGDRNAPGRELRPSSTCCGEVIALQAFVFIPDQGGGSDTGYGYGYYGGVAEELDGHELTITATVTDRGGRTHEMTRHYRAVDAGMEPGAEAGR